MATHRADSAENRHDGDMGEDERAPQSSGVGTDTVLAMFDRLPELIVLIGPDGRLRHANRRLLDTMGYSLDTLVGTNVFDYVHPDDLAYLAWSWEKREANPGETGIPVHARGRDADGSWRAVEIIGLSLLDDDRVGGMLMSMRELSDRAGVAESPARLRSLIDRTTDVVLLLDPAGTILYANRRLTSHYGLDQDRVVGRPLTSILHPDEAHDARRWVAALVAAGDRASSRIRARIESPDGTHHDVEWHGTNQLDDPLINGLIVSGRDIADLVVMEAQVARQTAELLHTADHDALTGLLNRRAFIERVGELLDGRRAAHGGGEAEVVALFCDLDRFKAVNDTHGHQAGDEVLAAVAGRIRSCVRDADVLGRYGGDEFTIVLRDDASEAVVQSLIARIGARLSEPIRCGPIEAAVGVTIGVSRQPVARARVDELLREADQAMYAKKPVDP